MLRVPVAAASENAGSAMETMTVVIGRTSKTAMRKLPHQHQRQHQPAETNHQVGLGGEVQLGRFPVEVRPNFKSPVF